MKIAMITDSVRQNPTGIGNYSMNLISSIMGYDRKNSYVFLDYSITKFNESKLIRINNPFKIFKTYLWHNLIPLKTKKIDVEYIFNFSAVPHIIPFKQKEIFFVYDISWYLYPEYHPRSRVMFYKYIFARCLRNSHGIVVDSISTKNDLIDIFNVNEKKIQVIYPTYNAIAKNTQNNLLGKHIPFLLYIGTIEPRKNITLVIKAFITFKKKYKSKHKLILCGKKGWLYSEIMSLIEQNHLANDVIYLGYITDEEKKYLLTKADIFIYPSFYEGFGIPVLEAMAYGCPVITSNTSSLPEVAGNAGIKINPNNVDELVISIEKLISNKKMREKMREKGFKQVENLNNTLQIKNFLKSLA